MRDRLGAKSSWLRPAHLFALVGAALVIVMTVGASAAASSSEATNLRAATIHPKVLQQRTRTTKPHLASWSIERAGKHRPSLYVFKTTSFSS